MNVKVKHGMKFSLKKFERAISKEVCGMSQDEIAEGLFDRSNLSKYKKGESKPTIYRLQEIADRIGVDLSEFFDFDENDLGKHHCDIPKNILSLTSGLKTHFEMLSFAIKNEDHDLSSSMVDSIHKEIKKKINKIKP